MANDEMKKSYGKARGAMGYGGKGKPKVDAMMTKGKKGAKRPAGKS